MSHAEAAALQRLFNRCPGGEVFHLPHHLLDAGPMLGPDTPQHRLLGALHVHLQHVDHTQVLLVCSPSSTVKAQLKQKSEEFAQKEQYLLAKWCAANKATSTTIL